MTLCLPKETHYWLPTAWVCLSQKSLQGIRDLKPEYVSCQHIHSRGVSGSAILPSFPSVSLETYKSGDTAETPARHWVMFISGERSAVQSIGPILGSIACVRETFPFLWVGDSYHHSSLPLHVHPKPTELLAPALHLAMSIAVAPPPPALATSLCHSGPI